MLYEYFLNTPKGQFYDITPNIHDAVKASGIKDGIAVIYCPHTTAGITINENADPDVVIDMALGYEKTFPNLPQYRHFEGNTTAHLKSSTIGASETVILSEGRLILGRWQSVYFCEFDPPRNRRFYVKVMEG